MSPSEFNSWLAGSALPAWSRCGVDNLRGGFFEAVNHKFAPLERPRRARLVARQVYCFSSGIRSGWSGDGLSLCQTGVDYLREFYIQPNYTIRKSVSAYGDPVDDERDLYDDAFVLLAFASVVKAFGRSALIEDLARKIAKRTLQICSSEDGELVDPGCAVLTNPMMHIAEAALAWLEAVPSEDGFWYRMAKGVFDRIYQECQHTHGVLPEVLLKPSGSNNSNAVLVEPGHQYEWSWLFARWSILGRQRQVLEEALRMSMKAEKYGLNPRSGAVISALRGDLLVFDSDAKLWAQCERAKAWHAILHHPMTSPSMQKQALKSRSSALSVLHRFLSDIPLGLWREVMRADGSFVCEPVRASSLYHLVCAANTVNRFAVVDRSAG